MNIQNTNRLLYAKNECFLKDNIKLSTTILDLKE